jgi:hypothetical protein
MFKMFLFILFMATCFDLSHGHPHLEYSLRRTVLLTNQQMFKMFLFILFIATCFDLSDGHPHLEHSLRRTALLTNLDNTRNRMHNPVIKIHNYRCENLKSYRELLFTINQPAPWNWALLEKPPIVQLLRNFSIFHGSINIITVYKNPEMLPILIQINPVHTIPSYLSKIQFNIIHPATSWPS